MAFNGTNPVSVGDPTRKGDYDRAFDNAVAVQDGSKTIDTMNIVSGADTIDSAFHIGEAVGEGGWLTSPGDTQLVFSGGAEYVSDAWVARSTEASSISMGGSGHLITCNTSLTDGNPFTPTVRWTLGVNYVICGSLYIQGIEIAAPGAPGPDKVRIFFRDVGGKTELSARFNTGAIQQCAIEP